MKLTTMVSAAAMAFASTAAMAANGFANPDLIGFEQMEYDAPVASDFAPAIGAADAAAGRQHRAAAPVGELRAHREGEDELRGHQPVRCRQLWPQLHPARHDGCGRHTQFTEFANGGFAVFGKDGTVQKATSDVAFWAAAGQTGANGDSRVLFDKSANRWVALSFGASVSDIQIAVSDTADATGTWKSTKFTGYSGPNGPSGSVADYPTLAIGNGAVYIGTNNFGSDPNNAAERFRGTTLNVIPLASLVNATAPTTTGLKQFVYSYDPDHGGVVTPYAGYAIQGVNNTATGGNGKVVAESLFLNDLVSYNVNGASTGNPTVSQGHYLGVSGYVFQDAARQPNAVPDIISAASSFPNNNRVVDALDPRISSNVYEAERARSTASSPPLRRTTTTASNALAGDQRGDRPAGQPGPDRRRRPRLLPGLAVGQRSG